MKSFCFGLLAVLVVFSSDILSTNTDDRFYELFEARAPFPEIFREAIGKDSTKQLEYIRSIQGHIDSDDDYAPYAKDLKTACQKVFDAKLRDIGYQGRANKDETLQAINNLETGKPVENEELEKLARQLMEQTQKVLQGSDEEKEKYIEKMIAYGTAPYDHSHDGEISQPSDDDDTAE